MPPRNVFGAMTFALTILLAVFRCPSPLFAANAASEEWNITADKITTLEHPRRIVGEGNIVLEKRERQQPPSHTGQDDGWADILGESEPAKPDTTSQEQAAPEGQAAMRVTTVIKADWISYDVEGKYIEAKGNISIVSGGDTLKAATGTVNLESGTGRFTDAIITTKEKNLHLEGKSIAQTGYNTYRIEEGWVITCKLQDGETPPWSFASSVTDIKKDGYATLRHARFYVGGVPIFYTPYMVIPVKDTRQTGFLTPEFSYSSISGFGVNLPLFINLSNSADITLFPEYMTQRGFKPGLEFRYALSDNNQGVFFGQFLKDQISNPSEASYYRGTPYAHTNDGRYWLYGKADATVGNGWQTRLDVDIASDADYLNELNSNSTGYQAAADRMLAMFGRGFDNRISLYRDNTLAASKYWSGTSLTATLSAENDLMENRPAGVATPLWKLPSISYNGALPVYATGMSFNWNTNYVDYWRENGIGANRVDLHPSISMPVPLSRYLESSVEVGARNTYYQVQKYGDAAWNNNTNQNRLLADAQFEVATTLMREFATASFDGAALEHQIRPYIRYNYIPNVDQSQLPSLDAVDRINEQSRITYGIDNFFNIIGASATAKEYVTFRIFQSYSLLDKDRDHPFQAIGTRMTWTPTPRARFKYEAYYDVYDHSFSSQSLAGMYTTSRGDIFGIDYSYYDTTTLDFQNRLASLQPYNSFGSGTVQQINATVQAHIADRWIASFEMEHSISSSTTQTFNVGLIYQAPCWSVQLQSQYNQIETRYYVVFSLANIASGLGLQF